MTDRRSFLARCLGLAVAPLLPLKAKADEWVMIPHEIPLEPLSWVSPDAIVSWSTFADTPPIDDFRTAMRMIHLKPRITTSDA